MFQQFAPPRRILIPLTAAASLLVAMMLSLGWLTATSSANKCGAKLCLDISHSPDNVAFVSPGSLVTYTVTVSNPGTSTATKVTLTDTLDPRTTLVLDAPDRLHHRLERDHVLARLGEADRQRAARVPLHRGDASLGGSYLQHGQRQL